MISIRLQLCVPSKYSATSSRRCWSGFSPFRRPFDQPSLCSFYARPSHSSFATNSPTHQRVYDDDAGSRISAVSSVLAARSVQRRRRTEWTYRWSCSAADGPSRAWSWWVWRTGFGDASSTAAAAAVARWFFAFCNRSLRRRRRSPGWNDVVCIACSAAEHAHRRRRRLGQEGRDQQADATGNERRSSRRGAAPTAATNTLRPRAAGTDASPTAAGSGAGSTSSSSSISGW